MKSSYSQNDCYKQCSQHWYWKYKEKLEGKDSGASTFFGTAIDSAVMYLLETGNLDFKDKFLDMWFEQVDRKKNKVQIWDNSNIIFGYADFDKDILIQEDYEELENQRDALQVTYLANDPVELYRAVAKIKRNPYKRIKDKELRYFNRASWISMRRKGLILLDSFYEQFYPKIERVISTQKFSLVKDEASGDIIQGVIDTVLKLKNMDKPIIFDLKTASKAYTQEQIDHSDQLTIYAAMEGRKYQTDRVGYIVLSKNINKEKESYCSECGFKKDGRHRKCNNLVDKDSSGKLVRCDGSWNDTILIRPKVQVLIESKSDDQIKKIMEEQLSIIVAMKNNVVFKNTSKCNSWYGNKCVYYDLCYKGDKTGLIKKD